MTQNVAKLVFWGVRGSTPTVERDSWRYGGNTACLEVTTPSGTRFILDCGTGLRTLGNHLHALSGRWMKWRGDGGIEAHVLVTHYHWDHIQGIPFFHPFFEAQNKFHFYSFQSKYLGRNSLRQVLEAQLAKPYFPVDVTTMAAARFFREVDGGEQWDIEGTHITTAWLNHPQGCLGYRLDTPVGSFVYATDNEPGAPDCDSNLRQLAQGADVLIYDAQYSPEQLASTRKGWGHSCWLEGVKIARECKVKNLVLFHHDPDSSSRVVDGFLSAARQEFAPTWAAMEGMSIALNGKETDVVLPEARLGQRRRLCFTATVSGQTEDGIAFEERATLRDISVQGAYLSMSNRPRLQSELRVVVEAPDGRDGAGALSLRATVTHCERSRGKDRNGVGVFFIEDAEPEPPRD
ncbi:MAG TPA: MBL fold metallo-hydrolase [Candidatus Acidoferrum sp.]|nr:MBL fold metallo-hydrolase [Candidatus Acidoferrum sp.]